MSDTSPITLTRDPETVAAGAEAAENWLSAHAEAQGQKFIADEILIEHREGDQVTGRLVAIAGVAWVFVKLLACDPDARGAGIGRALMARLEDEMRAAGKVGIWLDTYSFQAPGFYRNLGYEEVGTIADYPPGEARFFFAKRLDGRAVNEG